jgi:hypothetical protein
MENEAQNLKKSPARAAWFFHDRAQPVCDPDHIIGLNISYSSTYVSFFKSFFSIILEQ